MQMWNNYNKKALYYKAKFIYEVDYPRHKELETVVRN